MAPPDGHSPGRTPADQEVGERGDPSRHRIERAITAQVEERGPGRTSCPSEVARALVGDERFRELMPRVREVAADLADRGVIVVTQKGEVVDVRTAKGPVRLGPVT